jgi:hypothetical protein
VEIFQKSEKEKSTNGGDVNSNLHTIHLLREIQQGKRGRYFEMGLRANQTEVNGRKREFETILFPFSLNLLFTLMYRD